MFRFLLTFLFLSSPAFSVTQEAWHSGLNQVGRNGRIILSSAYLGGRLMDEVQAMKSEEAIVEIRANIGSSGVVWSSYARVCTTREALWRVHFPFNPITRELNAIGVIPITFRPVNGIHVCHENEYISPQGELPLSRI